MKLSEANTANGRNGSESTGFASKNLDTAFAKSLKTSVASDPPLVTLRISDDAITNEEAVAT